MGKVVARVIQGRLQKLAEKDLPESQCGFRRGRGFTDMVFTIRQLTEEATAKQYLIFVDLKKAYDSVPREALWAALKKLGISDQLVTIIRSFHENMKAKIHVDGELLDEIEVAHTLFNLYACVVAESWMSRMRNIDGVGTYVFYKLFRRYIH